MSRKSHSTGLKLFIFFLVAMMLFSAIGVMVIYLNVPTTTTTIPVTIPSDEPTTITLPTAEETAPTDTETAPEGNEQPTPTLDLDDVEAPTETIPEQADDAAERTEPTPAPVEGTPVEPTPAQQ